MNEKVASRMNDDNITFDDMQANRNNCNPDECLRCVHADMLQVERSYSCGRCGCEKGRCLGTWAMGYPFAKLPFTKTFPPPLQAVCLCDRIFAVKTSGVMCESASANRVEHHGGLPRGR